MLFVGERECVREDEGESEGLLCDCEDIDGSEGIAPLDPERLCGGLILSFPVGPLPKEGRFAGGKLRAVRNASFSVSSSVTLCSKA